MEKTILIVPYFGKFPSYFNLFLKSCAFNPDFTWLFFTNDKTAYNFPENTKCIYINFEEIKEIFKEKLGHDIVIIRPHKLCDYKVTYGYVFQDWIKEYDYWGHCDVDVIYGDLKEFIFPLYTKGYDKIFSLGHFSLYRNDPVINTLFQKPINGIRIDKIVFSNDFGYAFDEWHCPLGGINQIFEKYNLKFFKENYCADLKSSTDVFKLSNYSLEQKCYKVEDNYHQIFSWDEGILTKHYLVNSEVKGKAYPYIHFHKRKMSVKIDLQQNRYLVVPNKFVPFPKGQINKNTINIYSQKDLINKQYFRVKFINIQYRFKQIIYKLLF